VGEDQLRQAVLTGSAARRRPVGDCRCPNCLLAADGSVTRDDRPVWARPSGLLVPGILVVDGEPPAGDGEPPVGGPSDPAPLTRLITARPSGELPPGTRWLAAGERAELDGVRAVALPAGTEEGRPDHDRVVLVLGSGSRALLWAAGSGPLPEITLQALEGADLVAAVLDARPGGTEDGAGLVLAHQIARLRRAGALADDARLVAAGLCHTGPTPPRFARHAGAWGVDVLPDGTPLWAAGRSLSAAPARRTVVLGAAASGKSLVAESLLAALPDVVYVATGPQPDGTDPAWTARVAAHRRRRPAWWSTIEGGEPADLLARPGPALLVDSLGTWLSAAMTGAGCWDEQPGWRDRLRQQVDDLVAAWRQAARPVVAVAEEVGWGVVPATASGGHFRDALGGLNRRICEESEQVLLVVAGRPIDLDAAGITVG
jgi:adenosylcobinamide kinase/adenosylcobinamide-phosphate guanylyltransferase